MYKLANLISTKSTTSQQISMSSLMLISNVARQVSQNKHWKNKQGRNHYENSMADIMYNKTNKLIKGYGNSTRKCYVQ